MSNVGAKVPVYEGVSGGPMSLRLVVLRSDLRGDVILDVIPLERGGGNVDQLLAQVDVRDDRFWARIVGHGVLGERVRVRARGCVHLVRNKLVPETRLGVCERELRVRGGAPVVLAVPDRHKSTRQRTMDLSGCGASAVSRRKSEGDRP